jgi:ankyrin repeat protein
MQMSNSAKCQCLTSKGTQCKNFVSNKIGKDHRYCYVHQNCKKSLVPPKKKITEPILPKDVMKYVLIPYFEEDDVRKLLEFTNLDEIQESEKLGVNLRDVDDYALQWASQHGQLSVVKYLIEIVGANVHANDDNALFVASQSKNSDIVKYLVANGANIRTNFDTALRTAAESGDLSLVKFLVEHGAPINDTSNYLGSNEYQDILTSAIKSEQYAVVKYLFNQNAEISDEAGQAFIDKSLYGDLDGIKILLQLGDFDPNDDYDSEGNVIVSFDTIEAAILSDNLDIIMYFYNRGNINSSNIDKYLQFAISIKKLAKYREYVVNPHSEKIINFLLKHGATNKN